MLGLGFRKGNESPIIAPGLIVNRTDSLAFGSEVPQIEPANFHPQFRGLRTHDSAQSIERFGKFGEPPRMPIPFFNETAFLAEALVVRRIVRRKHRRRMLETVDE